MNASDLVELAGLVSSATPALLRGDGKLNAAGGETYWTASKCRIDRWSRRLKESGSLVSEAGNSTSAPQVLYVCEEILMAEILTRVWTAACAASDQSSGERELELIGRSVLVSHLESRRRVLNLMSTAPPGAAQRAARSLDHLRRVCERWADLLLAPFAPICNLEMIAHDRRRVLDFAQDSDEDARRDEISTTDQRRQLLSTSLRQAFQRPDTAANRNADLNAQIAAGILGCLGDASYDGPDVCADWLCHARLISSTAHAEQLISRLLSGNPTS